MERVICIMGPTASGKTKLACALADHLKGAIISVDSAMIYRGLNIGTAKPSAQELQLHPHRLIDILDPRDHYSAALFCRDALLEIDAVLQEGRTPILVGGTMLYFHALLQGLSKIPASQSSIRDALIQRAEKEGLESLYQELQRIDSQAASRIKAQDRQRIIRALEVYQVAGRPLSSFWGDRATQGAYQFHSIALMPEDRSLLHAEIQRRFMHMMAQGFLEEVQRLYQRGDLHADLPAIRTVGYRQLWQYCAGVCPDLDQAMMKGIAATRQLAKRQMTWIRNWPELIQLNAQDPQLFKMVIQML